MKKYYLLILILFLFLSLYKFIFADNIKFAKATKSNQLSQSFILPLESPKYSCINNICVQDPNGSYKDYATCNSECRLDIAVTDLDIRTFICKNKNFDLTFLNEYLSQHPDYQFAPSTTYASSFYNAVAKNTCPESQRNRPVEFYAQAKCLRGNCPSSKLRISITPFSVPSLDEEKKFFETSYNSSYPKIIKDIYIFNKPFDYLVQACIVDQNNQQINDANISNNCKEQILRIFDYMCILSFCSQNQRDINNPSSIFNFEPLMYKILEVFVTTDLPCRYYRNEICKTRFGF